jgi:hypothetical protein
MSNDRRRSSRIEILGRLQGRVVAMDTPIVVREISLGGMQIESGLVFTAGDIHEFHLTLGDGSQIPLRGRVMHSRETVGADGKTTFLTGLQFVDDDATESDAVSDIIDHLK